MSTEKTRRVEYDFLTTALGTCLIARSARGICELAFVDGQKEEALVELVRNYPCAEILPVGGVFDDLGEHLLSNNTKDCALDISGTFFQRSVWDELQKTSCGEAISYKELARRLGRPDAIRAVAGAVAGNRIAVLIPCHRVIRSDGALGGYRWGIDRKAALLKKERLNG